jgi:hypothetical protein
LQRKRLSLRDISVILKKHGVNHGITSIDDDGDNKKSHSHNEKATQAYRLLSEGKKPVQVAIELNLREGQVDKFFREFWKLKNLNGLNEIYPRVEQYLPGFLKLQSIEEKRFESPKHRVICRPYGIGCCKTSGTPRSISKTSRQSPRSSI